MRFCIKRSSPALLIALCMALSACQHSDSDPPVSAAGASGASTNGSTPAHATSAGGTSDQQDGTPDEHDGDETGGDSGSPGDDWPTRRKVPGGTLTWTVLYKGNGTTQTPEQKEVAALQRKMEGQAHMAGFAGNPRKKVATPLDAINQAMQACGGDAACQQAAAMQAMAKVRQNPGAFENGLKTAQAESQRDTAWGADSCSAHATVDDTATWSGITSDGFNTSVATRRGGQAVPDCIVQIEEGDRRPRLIADDDSKTYELALPPADIRVTGTIAGRVEPVPRLVRLPPIVIRGVQYTTLEKPLSGKVTVKSGAGHGIWSEGWDIPLTEEVTWTFTPDAK